MTIVAGCSAGVGSPNDDCCQKHILRGDALVGLTGMLHGLASVTYDSAQKRKAETLQAIVKRQGRQIGRGSYVGATSAIRVILEEFDAPENAALVAELGLGPAVEKLRAEQAGFLATFMEKMAIEARGATPKLKDLRGKIGNVLDELTTYVSYKADEDPQGFETLVNELNEQIAAVMTAVRARATRNQAENAPQAEAGKEGSTA
jgi:hypothetical protein